MNTEKLTSDDHVKTVETLRKENSKLKTQLEDIRGNKSDCNNDNKNGLEKRASLIFELSLAPTFIWEKQGSDFILIDFNDASMKETKGIIRDYLGIKISELYSDRPEEIKEFKKCFKEKKSITREINYKLLTTGEEKILDIRYAYMPPNMVMVQSNDKTEAIKIQKELKEERDFINTAMESMTDTVFVFDKKSRTPIRWNKALSEISGYSNEEISKMKIPDDWYDKKEFDLIEKAASSLDEKGHFNVELNLICKDGKKIPIEFIGSYIKGTTSEKDLLIAIGRDISERKLTEKVLKESEEKFRKIYNQTPVMLHSIDKEGRIISLSDFGLKKLGYTREEMIGKKSIDFLNEKSREKAIKYMVPKLFTEGFTENVHYQVVKKNGEEFEVSLAAVTIKENNEVVGAMAVMTDITEQLEIQRALQDSEERFRLLFNKAPMSYQSLDFEGCFVDVNQTFLDFLGYDRDDIVGNWFGNILHESSKETFKKNFPKFKSCGQVGSVEFNMLRKDGQVRTVSLNGKVGYDEHGNFKQTHCIFYDITDKKKTEEYLKKMSSAVEQSNISIAILDKDGIIEYVNPKFCQVSGYSSDELIGQSPRTLDSESMDINEQDEIWKDVLAGNDWSGIFTNKRKNGEEYWESAVISSIKNKKNEITHFVEIKEDITEKIHTEKELDQYRKSLETLVKKRTAELMNANDKLEMEIIKQKEIESQVKASLEKEKELNELKTRFISTASHEFRTPLTSIMTSAEILEMFGKDCTDDEFSEHIDRIINSVDYLTKLMDDVLTMSRTESGKIKFMPAKLDFYTLCTDLINDFRHSVSDKHIISLNYSIEQKEFIMDEKLIRFIIANLLSNAVKYSPNGGDIELSLNTEHSRLRISVLDNGIGIPEKDQKHMFEAFHRAINTKDIPGTGLGMSIVKKSVEMHNGEITFKSKENAGTEFIIYLPII